MGQGRTSWLVPFIAGIIVPLAVVSTLAALGLTIMSAAPTPPPVGMHNGSVELLTADTWTSPKDGTDPKYNQYTTDLHDKPAHLYLYGVDPKGTTSPQDVSLTCLKKNWKITVSFVNPDPKSSSPIDRLWICSKPNGSRTGNAPNCDTDSSIATTTISVMGDDSSSEDGGTLQEEPLDRPHQRIRYDINHWPPPPPTDPSAHGINPRPYPEPRGNHVSSLTIQSGSKKTTYHCVDSACDLEIRTHRKSWIEF
jgi:hypothetical protein